MIIIEVDLRVGFQQIDGIDVRGAETKPGARQLKRTASRSAGKGCTLTAS